MVNQIDLDNTDNMEELEKLKDDKKIKEDKLREILRNKSIFVREVDICLFFQDIHEDPQKTVYKLDIRDGSVLTYTNKELDFLYPTWSKRKKEDEETDFPDLQMVSALIHKTPYVTNKYFSYEQVLSKTPDCKKENCCLNTYEFPKYLLKYDPEVSSGKIPEIFMDFLEHLFKGDVKEVEYCLNWISWSLDPEIRHLPYMCLIDAKEGVGKGRLTTVIRRLHGDRKNSRELSDKFLKGQFNSQIEGITFAAINEVHLVGEEQNNRCKALIDDMIEIEAKGVDAREVRNYCKILINSNEIALNVTKESRRFSALKTTDIPLKENNELLSKWGGMKNFLEELKSDKNIEDLGIALTWYREKFLKKFPEQYNHLTIFFSEYTDNLIEKSMPEWQNEMLYEMPRKVLQDWMDAGHILNIDSKDRRYLDLPRASFKEMCRRHINFYKGKNNNLPTFAKLNSILEAGYLDIIRPVILNGERLYRIYNNYNLFTKTSLL